MATLCMATATHAKGGDALQRKGTLYKGRDINTRGGDALQRKGNQFKGREFSQGEGRLCFIVLYIAHVKNLSATVKFDIYDGN